MKWKIGNVEINNRVVLAPMAGVCNSAFRTIAKEMGVGLIYAEMVSDKAIFYNNQKVAVHTRLYGNKEWNINIMHFINTLGRKPGALRGSVAFEQTNSALKEIYHKYFNNEARSFIELLDLIGTYDINVVTNIINSLSQKSIPVNTENIKMILNRNNDTTIAEANKSDMQNEIEKNARRHLQMYDEVIGITGLEGGVAI